MKRLEGLDVDYPTLFCDCVVETRIDPIITGHDQYWSERQNHFFSSYSTIMGRNRHNQYWSVRYKAERARKQGDRRGGDEYPKLILWLHKTSPWITIWSLVLRCFHVV